MKPDIGRTYALTLIFALATADYSALAADNKRVRQWKTKVNESKTAADDAETGGFSASGQLSGKLLVGNNCTGCFVRDEAKRARIERIKEELLQKLQFVNPPNVTAADLPNVASHLRGMLGQWYDPLADEPYDVDSKYQRMLRDTRDVDIDSAQTERVYAFATEVPASLGLPESRQRAYFRFSQSTMNNKVDNAVLHFYLNQPTIKVDEITTQIKARLFIVDNNENGSRTEVSQKTFKKHLRYSGHWAFMDVTNVVDRWFKMPNSNFGLELEAVYDGENLIAFPRTGNANGGRHTMYLEINTSLPRRRSKRETPRLDCEEKDNDTRCCRYPLVVDFESFGWDWVIAPKKYRANYCSGECPFRHLQRYVHTHIMTQANPKGNAGPCCYPTQMAPILMVYFNENKEVLVSKVPGMIVSRCGCA